MTAFAMLTATENGSQQNLIPIIAAAVCGIILLIALFIGLKKGIRRVSWKGLVWSISVLSFFAINTFVFTNGSPLDSVLQSIAVSFVQDETLAVVIGAFLSDFVLALGCVLITFILYGICSLLFRPSIRKIKKTADMYTMDEEGVEYDDEYYDYDDYEEYQTRNTYRRKGYGTPSLFGRLLGGVVCVLNVSLVFITVAAIALLAIDATSLKATPVGTVLQIPVVATLLPYVKTYTLDAIIIGIIVSYAHKGQENGLMETVRSLFATFGSLIGIIFAFYLPFSPFAADGFLGVYVQRCMDVSFSLLGATVPQFAPVVGRLIAGLILCIFLLIVIWLIGKLLKKLTDAVESNGFLRAIDGSLACVIYTVVGVVIVLAVWALWFVLSYFGIFRAELLFTSSSSLSSGLFYTMDAFLSPVLEQFLQSFSGIPA